MSNHLYWRLYLTEGFGASGNLGYYAISEIEMRATAGGADQCNGGTATAHDSYSATYAPSKAFDNLISSTWWASYTNNPVGWIKYAFASAVDVTELAITNRNLTTNYPPKSFKLQWSDDDSTWTDAGSWSNLSWVLGETKLFRLPDVVETPVDQPYLYWRLNFAVSMGVPTGKTYWFNISEIEMRATQGGADQCENGTSDAHNYYSSSYGPGKAFDNSSSSFWGSWPTPDPGPPYWIKYSFTSAVYVREVVITNRNDPSLTNYAPASFKLQGSNDNTTWYTVAEWTGVSFGQGETKTFRPMVYAKGQNRMPYGLLVEAYNASPYAAQVATAQSQPFDMPPLIVAQQVATPFAITMATGQSHLFEMPPLLVANQAAMPFGILLAAQINQLYECADLIRQWSLPYDLTTRAASSLAQPFGVAVAEELASPYVLTVTSSLTTGYAWTVERSLEQPYASQVVAGYDQPYGLELAVQNDQSFAILFAANACAQPCPIQLEVYHVQPWQLPVAQANVQPLYGTICQAGRQHWSILLPVAQANGQSFDRTITVVAAHRQPHDLLERNPVARALSGSWDLSATRPSLHRQGGVRAIHFGVSL